MKETFQLQFYFPELNLNDTHGLEAKILFPGLWLHLHGVEELQKGITLVEQLTKDEIETKFSQVSIEIEILRQQSLIGKISTNWFQTAFDVVKLDETIESSSIIALEEADSDDSGSIVVSFALKKLKPPLLEKMGRSSRLPEIVEEDLIEPEEILFSLGRLEASSSSATTADRTLPRMKYRVVDGLLVSCEKKENVEEGVTKSSNQNSEPNRNPSISSMDKERVCKTLDPLMIRVLKAEVLKHICDTLIIDPPSEGDTSRKCSFRAKMDEDNGAPRICPACFKNLDSIPASASCPLCGSRTMKKHTCPFPCDSGRPVILSTSEEFGAGKMNDSAAAGESSAGVKDLYGLISDSSQSLLDSRYRRPLTRRVSALRMKNGLEKVRRRKGGRSSQDLDEFGRPIAGKGGKSSKAGKGRREFSDSELDKYAKEVKNYGKGRSGSGFRTSRSASGRKLTAKEQIALVKQKFKEIQEKNRMGCFQMSYSNKFGKNYPENLIGHQQCAASRGLVPPNMGWLWNVPTLGINQHRLGWKPGAVTKPIKKIMMHFLSNYPCDTLPVSKTPKKSIYTDIAPPESSVDKPTLRIQKERGEYVINFNPLKDSKSLKESHDPYLPCGPIKFRLTKTAEAKKLEEAKRVLRELGFLECKCKERAACTCRSEKEQEMLEKEMRHLSVCLGLRQEMTLDDFRAEKDDRNLDVEFTPPSVMAKRLGAKKKVDVAVAETQYNAEDIAAPRAADKDLIMGKRGAAGGKKGAAGTVGGGGKKGASGAGDKNISGGRKGARAGQRPSTAGGRKGGGVGGKGGAVGVRGKSKFGQKGGLGAKNGESSEGDDEDSNFRGGRLAGKKGFKKFPKGPAGFETLAADAAKLASRSVIPSVCCPMRPCQPPAWCYSTPNQSFCVSRTVPCMYRDPCCCQTQSKCIIRC